MLVVVSDLHLTDGSCGPGLDPGAFEVFAPRLAELALRASWRTDGRYRPLDRIDLLLLGDTLDFTRSRHWLAGETRPWPDLASPGLLEKALQIADGIVRANEPALRILRAIGAEEAIRLPQASAAGQPLAQQEGQPIPVALHYMVGNADWLLHVKRPGFELLRQRVCHALGLANEYRQPFPHDAAESEELLEASRRHRTLARHGDAFDPLAMGEDRDASSVGEALAIEVIQRFLVEVETRFASELPPGLAAAIRELDSFRPMALAAAYLDGLLERSGVRPATVKELKRTWDRLVVGLLDLPQLRERGSLGPFDAVDPLADALLFQRKRALGWSANIRRWLHSLRGATDDSYAPHALAEPEYRNRRARHVVYGHTHRVETIPLDASHADGFTLQQTYFNAGTWRRTFEPTRSVAGEREFLSADQFSFLAFFQGDERGGRPYETWTGSLGAAAETFVPPPSPVVAAPSVAAPLPLRAPHFILPNLARSDRR